MSPRRRDFLGWLGASALLAAGRPLEAQPLPTPAGPLPRPIDPTWDMSWTDRIQGKYRAVFDSPGVGEGGAIWRAVGWRKQHQEVYGTDLSELGAVLVIRHEAIPLAMNDQYWARFKVGKRLKLKDFSTNKWAVVNPVRRAPDDTPPKWVDYSLERFMGSGGIVLACNLALQEVVAEYRKADKLTREAAQQKARENLVPGIILQPSGIFAALCAQQAGCHYILAS